MHKHCPLSAGLRELIAAYTSSLNHCEFCMKAHAAVASKLLGDEALVWSVIDDLETSALDEKEKALLRFVRKVTLAPASITAADTQTSQRRRLGRRLHLLRHLCLRPVQLLQPLDLGKRCQSRKRRSLQRSGFPNGCCRVRQVAFHC